ncbi:MAG: phosphotransferase [Pseudomonadota bacterium]
MPAPAEIPELPEQLTAAWLSGALDWSVRAVEQQVLGEGQGFLGDILRLRLDSEDPAAPPSIIAKLPKLNNRAMGEMLGVYEREVCFFQEFGEQIPVRIPRVFFSHYDPDAGSAKQKEILAALDGLPRFLTPLIGLLGKRVAAAKHRRYLVLMEDLAEFEAGDQLAGADPETCARVLEQFAAVHSAFWNGTGIADRFWLLPMDIDARMREGMFRRTHKRYVAEAGADLAPYVAWFADHSAELTRRLAAEAPPTLMHGDLRLDNVCFAGQDCAFIDWQLVRTGPAAYDVAYFLTSALKTAATVAEEDEILKRYHRALGRADYPYERFFRDYQRGLLLSLPATAPMVDFDIDTGRGQAMMSRWRERLRARITRVHLNSLL